MKFIDTLKTLLIMHRNGDLESLVVNISQMLDKTVDMNLSLYMLERNLKSTRSRLERDTENLIQKSLGMPPLAENETRHISFETTYRVIAMGLSPFLVGPAGSGKSTILAQAAAAMDLEFYPMSVNALTSDYNIIGYNDANGKYVSTSFRQAYEHGGLFSFEEIDAGNPNVLTVINNAMSQDKYMFPDGVVKKHPKFILAASGNTYGTGANLQYVGRNPLDAATLDRFVIVRTDYDTELEGRLCQNKQWLNYVQSVRSVINKYDMKLIAGTRAVLNGEKLLAAGLPTEVVEKMVLFKGAPAADIDKIKQNVR